MNLFILLLIGLAIAIVIAEITLRRYGHRPHQPREMKREVTPGGRLYQPHPTLGYRHLPGRYTITLENAYSFEVTHIENTLRATGPIDAHGSQTPRDEIWIFGCSFTHGYALNDHETFPWLLQTEFPDYKVVNFGVGGYGTLHSLIQFREALKTEKIPVLVVLVYSELHDVRNTFARNRKKQMAPNNKLGPLAQPFARLAKDGHIACAMARVAYKEFPFMRRSALVNSLEIKFNDFQERWLNGHEVTKRIIDDFYGVANEQGVKLGIAGITDHPLVHDILDYAAKRRIPSMDVSVNLRKKENNNLPYDGHPSAKANYAYAQHLIELVRAQIE